MRSGSLLSLGLALFLTAPLTSAAENPRGHLVVVGGGATDHRIVERALALAGGVTAQVAILPQASALPDAGENSAAMWRELGVEKVRVVDATATAEARTILESAAVIWMPGGDQNKLMAALTAAHLDELIRARYRAGAVVGGTSAGAAVVSEVMLTGEADLQSLTPGATKTAPGLALWPEVIVDQHFLKRQRFNRLLSAVLDHPDKIGVGIDEGTAVIVSGGRWEVLGASSVLIVDARHAADGIRLRVLRPGMNWQPAAAPPSRVLKVPAHLGWDCGLPPNPRR